MKLKVPFFAILMLQASFDVSAREILPDTVNNFKVRVSVPRRFYVGNGFDLAMLSTALVSKPGQSAELTAPRFTAVVNIGFHFNYDLSKKAGIFTGIGLRNMGFTEQVGHTVYKRRVYALGIPFGIKIGDLRNRNFAFAGAGVDLPFHYKEKTFTRENKTKTKRVASEWFGEQTPRVMPYIFVGHSFDPGVTLKLQYYPLNFLNTDYSYEGEIDIWPKPIVKPYTGYQVNLLLLSLGIDIHYGQYRIQEREYQELKRQREQAAQRL